METILLPVTSTEYQAITGALHVAAEKYRQNAVEIEKAWFDKAAGKKVAELFNAQAEEVSKLLAKWEN